MKDVVIIGGGPSGLMAAVASASHGASVLLLDKGSKLGRKLAISGGGRCNVTNRVDAAEIIKHIPGNGRFMYSPFSIFNNEDIIAFFEGLNIPLKEEDNGRMFPVNGKAIEVVRALLNKIRSLNVEIRTKTEVADIHYTEDAVSAVELTDGELIHAKNVIVAVGGMSVPYTGSTGDGYPWAKKAGHTITDLYPTEVPITMSDSFIHTKELQGLSLRDVQLSVIDPKKGKLIKAHRGDMIFTHFGVSGPIGLRGLEGHAPTQAADDGHQPQTSDGVARELHRKPDVSAPEDLFTIGSNADDLVRQSHLLERPEHAQVARVAARERVHAGESVNFEHRSMVLATTPTEAAEGRPAVRCMST